jgi:hypothetical protein
MELQDALIKAKLATEKQRPKEQPKQTQENEKPKHTTPQRLTNPEFAKFEDLFGNEKSKPFVIHLLHAFLPFPDNDYIWGWEDKKWKNGKKCCVCGLETLSRNDIFQNFDKQTDSILEGLRLSVSNEHFNASEFYKTRKQELFGDRLMGITSQKTSCIMCNPCYEVFANWVSIGLLLRVCQTYFCN